MLLEPQLPAGELQAGDDIPETSVVILNGSKQRVVKGTLGGDKQNYAVTQRLWFCPPGEEPQETFCSSCRAFVRGSAPFAASLDLAVPSSNPVQGAS